MHLPKFEQLRPASLKEASQLLKEYGPRSVLAAGGTDIYPRMKYKLLRPEWVISLKGLPVEPPAVTREGDLHLDALMTLADVARSSTIRERAPLLAEAALNVGSNQIRHMGTLGGNICLENRCLYYNQTHTYQFVEPCFKRKGERCYLIPKGKKCWAVFTADTVPALIALGALVNIIGPQNARQLPLERLYTGDALRPLALSGSEIVTEVIVPAQSSMCGASFVKFNLRGGMEFAALTVAILLNMEDDSHNCNSSRIIVGSVSAAPVRARKAEQAMVGQHLSMDLFEEVAQILANEVSPFPHHGYSVGYLTECLKVQSGRALNMALERVRPQ